MASIHQFWGKDDPLDSFPRDEWLRVVGHARSIVTRATEHARAKRAVFTPQAPEPLRRLQRLLDYPFPWRLPDVAVVFQAHDDFEKTQQRIREFQGETQSKTDSLDPLRFTPFPSQQADALKGLVAARDDARGRLDSCIADFQAAVSKADLKRLQGALGDRSQALTAGLMACATAELLHEQMALATACKTTPERRFEISRNSQISFCGCCEGQIYAEVLRAESEVHKALRGAEVFAKHIREEGIVREQRLEKSVRMLEEAIAADHQGSRGHLLELCVIAEAAAWEEITWFEAHEERWVKQVVPLVRAACVLLAALHSAMTTIEGLLEAEQEYTALRQQMQHMVVPSITEVQMVAKDIAHFRKAVQHSTSLRGLVDTDNRAVCALRTEVRKARTKAQNAAKQYDNQLRTLARLALTYRPELTVQAQGINASTVLGPYSMGGRVLHGRKIEDYDLQDDGQGMHVAGVCYVCVHGSCIASPACIEYSSSA